MKRNDIVYYAGYLILFIMLGVWMLAWAMGSIGLGEAFMLWLLSGGVLLIAIGGSNISGMAASNFQLATGLVLAVFILIMLGVTSDIIGGLVGAALGIILIGIIGLMLLFRGIRMEA